MSIFDTTGEWGQFTAYETLENGKTWRTKDERTVRIAEYGSECLSGHDVPHLNIVSFSLEIRAIVDVRR